MAAPRKYPEELRERAVRTAVEARRDPGEPAGRTVVTQGAAGLTGWLLGAIAVAICAGMAGVGCVVIAAVVVGAASWGASEGADAVYDSWVG